VNVLPLKTRVLGPGDDVVDVAREALTAVDVAPGKSDVLVVCESPLAITQGRIRRIDEMTPGPLARVLCRFFRPAGSLSTAYGMQAAIDETGRGRIVLAFVAGCVGRLVGRRGDFYRLAGRPIAWIDDVTGTMPPYTQDIVLGPSDPLGVARRVSAALGCGAVVADANDLGAVEIMGAAGVNDLGWVVDVLRSNPQGNDDQCTPLVLLRG
jgi:hypothetical protein